MLRVGIPNGIKVPAVPNIKQDKSFREIKSISEAKVRIFKPVSLTLNIEKILLSSFVFGLSSR
jgi:hypothetical protein